DEELESARGAEALHRRRWDHEDARLLDLGRAPLQVREELVGRRPVTPLLPRLRADEDGTGVRAVGARRAREPRERHREVDARRGEDDLARSPHDGVGPLERRPVGELDRDDEVALVLRRNEARRDGPEPDHDETEQQGIGGERKGGSAYQAADGPSIAMAGPLEDPVEHAEEPAEEAVPQASEPVLLGALGLEEERAHRRAQRERIERRQYGRHRDREGELPIELARDAAEERR